MTKRIDPNVATTRTVGVRLTPEQLTQLDEQVALSNASAVGAQASQASVARALLVEALQARSAGRAKRGVPTRAAALTQATDEQRKEANGFAFAIYEAFDRAAILASRYLSKVRGDLLTPEKAEKLRTVVSDAEAVLDELREVIELYDASGDLEAKPTHTKATATTPSKPAPTPKVPTLPPIENAVLAALKANEQPGADLLDVAAVVRALEAQGHERTAIHAEFVRLGTAGVDVLELRPDSGNGNERQEDRAIVPKGLDGVPLLTARLLKRTEAVPSQEHDSDALRARLKAHRVATGKTERQVADACGIQKDRMNRWTNGTKKTLSPDDEKKLVAYLDSVGA